MAEVRLRVIDQPKDLWSDTVEGDMWRTPDRDHAGREAWFIRLPNDVFWCTTDRPEGTEQMWDVSGEPPNITVSPSINAIGSWHGFITDGVARET